MNGRGPSLVIHKVDYLLQAAVLCCLHAQYCTFFVRSLTSAMVTVWPALISFLNMLVRASFCMAVRETCLDGATTPLDDGGGDLVGLVVTCPPSQPPSWDQAGQQSELSRQDLIGVRLCVQPKSRSPLGQVESTTAWRSSHCGRGYGGESLVPLDLPASASPW